MRAGAARRGVSDRLAALVVDSPLRRVDPRVKLALSLALSLAIMLPLKKLLVLLVIYAVFLAWARLLPVAGRLLWRLKWVLATLFIVDWVLVSFDLAVLVSLRVVLLERVVRDRVRHDNTQGVPAGVGVDAPALSVRVQRRLGGAKPGPGRAGVADHRRGPACSWCMGAAWGLAQAGRERPRRNRFGRACSGHDSTPCLEHDRGCLCARFRCPRPQILPPAEHGLAGLGLAWGWEPDRRRFDPLAVN